MRSWKYAISAWFNVNWVKIYRFFVMNHPKKIPKRADSKDCRQLKYWIWWGHRCRYVFLRSAIWLWNSDISTINIEPASTINFSMVLENSIYIVCCIGSCFDVCWRYLLSSQSHILQYNVVNRELYQNLSAYSSISTSSFFFICLHIFSANFSLIPETNLVPINYT